MTPDPDQNILSSLKQYADLSERERARERVNKQTSKTGRKPSQDIVVIDNQEYKVPTLSVAKKNHILKCLSIGMAISEAVKFVGITKDELFLYLSVHKTFYDAVDKAASIQVFEALDYVDRKMKESIERDDVELFMKLYSLTQNRRKTDAIVKFYDSKLDESKGKQTSSVIINVSSKNTAPKKKVIDV